MKHKLKKLFLLIKPKKYTALLLIVVTLIAAISESFSLALILPFLNIVINGDFSGKFGELIIFINSFFNFDNYILLVVVIIILFQLTKSLMLILQSFLSSKFVWELSRDWNKIILEKYLNSTFNFYVKQKQGILLNNLLKEPTNSSQSLLKICQLITQLLFILTLVFALIVINVKATLLIGGSALLLYFLVMSPLKSYSQGIGKRNLDLNQKIHTVSAESLISMTLIKSFSLEKSRQKIFNLLSDYLCVLRIKIQVLAASFTPLVEIILVLVLVIVLYFVTSFEENNIKSMLPTLGVIIIIGQKLLSRFGTFLSQKVSIHFLLPSLSLVYDLLNEEIEQEVLDKGINFSKLESDIVFNNVSFEYSNNNKVLNNLSIVIPMNKMTAFIGPSGIGKSTIANLLIGFYKPVKGDIFLNGKIPLTDYNLSSLRSKISYVTQETVIFNTTIEENIRMGKLEANIDEIIRASVNASIHDFIISLPEGYKTLVGDRGARLSGGQKQRIAIARAILRDPEIYIFDEATSSLDNESEKYIQASIEKLGKIKTVIVIAHRLSTIENADVVYDLSKL